MEVCASYKSTPISLESVPVGDNPYGSAVIYRCFFGYSVGDQPTAQDNLLGVDYPLVYSIQYSTGNVNFYFNSEEPLPF